MYHILYIPVKFMYIHQESRGHNNLKNVVVVINIQSNNFLGLSTKL